MNKKAFKSQRYDLRKLRKSLEMSQSAAAESIDVSVRKWQRIEKEATLEQVTAFIIANAGMFVFPENPFDIFQIKEQIFKLSDIKV